MNREFIERIIDHPYEKQNNKMERGSFYIEEIFQNYNEGKYIKGELQCGKQENQFWRGSVEVCVKVVDKENDLKELHVGFDCLHVHAQIENQGIGKCLMLHVIEVIKEFKEYYCIKENVAVTGWLSTADKWNKNWNKSIPFYEKVGKLAKVECYFTIQDDNQHYTAAEFLEKANADGKVTYLV